MPANMVLLEKITIGAAGAASVTFSGIPQTGYTDLVIAYSMRTNRSTVNAYPAVQFNGSTSSYSQKEIYGTGSGAFSGSASIIQPYADGNGATSNTFSNGSIYIPNYTSSNYKSVSVDAVSENNGVEAHQQLLAGLWSNTAAITSIAILAGDGSTTILANSTFYLYGVAKLGTTPAIVPYATGGDTIMTDGTYWYHTFTSSGTFTPAKALSCDYLVVAGGGGGGKEGGGGGGAGGLRSTVTATGGGGSLESKLSLGSGTGYTVTIGAGGAGSTSAGAPKGTSGSNSVFSTITSTGGGGGGAYFSAGFSTGLNGGSGGGGSGTDTGSSTGGTGTANQGYAGGGQPNSQKSAAGGGGAGSVGADGATNGGNGGSGVSVSITGSSVAYAGGGGGGMYYGGVGGTATAGGGGGGGSAGNGTAATANTGGGGGGGGNSGGNGANGGSGIVVVRYLV